MTPAANLRIEQNIRNTEALDRAMASAYQRVIRMHTALNVPIAVWRDGAVVELSAASVAESERRSTF